MAAKSITREYVDELVSRIGQGETPKKNTEISAKEFVRQMLPHVKNFVAQGYAYKEIADFIGHVSAADLKKAVAKDTSESQEKKGKKAEEQEKPGKAVPPKAPSKGSVAKKAQASA